MPHRLEPLTADDVAEVLEQVELARAHVSNALDMLVGCVRVQITNRLRGALGKLEGAEDALFDLAIGTPNDGRTYR